jgi:hypothetical protein
LVTSTPILVSGYAANQRPGFRQPMVPSDPPQVRSVGSNEIQEEWMRVVKGRSKFAPVSPSYEDAAAEAALMTPTLSRRRRGDAVRDVAFG